MNKYQNGKIYKIVDVGYNKCYIGSTCEELSPRMARHRYMFTQHSTKGKESYRSCNCLFEEFGVENVKIEEIEKYPCNDRDELLAREGYYIQNTDCNNKKVAGRTFKGWYNDNRDKCLENLKSNYSKNIEDRKAYKSTPFKCECGSIVSLSHKARHLKSLKHQTYLNQQSQQT